jgi:hypothetical protein
MDSVKPAHPRRLAIALGATPARSTLVAGVVVVHAVIAKHIFARRTARAFLWVVFAIVSVPLSGADVYLPRFGPAPLRFVAPPPSVEFTWPSPPATSLAATNHTHLAKNSQENATNSIPNDPVSTPQTNSPSGPDISSIASPTEPLPSPVSSETNPLSASNLLIVTPQMLADYFRGNFDGTFRPLTNGVAGPEVLFNPPYAIPLLKPSSQATYRTQ